MGGLAFSRLIQQFCLGAIMLLLLFTVAIVASPDAGAGPMPFGLAAADLAP